MTEDTKCPKLNGVVKQNLIKEIRDTNSNVAKLQTLTLDTVAPFVHILEEVQKGSLTAKTAVDATGAGLTHMDNAFAHMTFDYRKPGLRDPKQRFITSRRGRGDIRGSVFLLFSDTFERRMKDHLESLKCLQRSMAPKSGTDQFFRKGRSPYPT